MLLFWILATLMTAVALAFVLVPLLRRRGTAGPSHKDANLDVLRGQRQEIEADVARGILPADARDEALAELVARAEADLAPERVAVAPGAKRSWVAAAVAAIGVPALAFGVYLAVGNPSATDPKTLARADHGADPQVVAMVEALAQKVRERPDDAKGWSLLARSMAALGRFAEAARAYEHLSKLEPRDPQVLADYADALGMAQGRNLAGKPYELAKAALAIDPKHRKSLALAGTAAMEAGDFAGSLRYWQTLADASAGTEDEARVRAIIEEVRTRAGAAGKSLPPAIAAAPATKAPATLAKAPATVAKAPAPEAKPAAPSVAKAVAGSVTISPEMAGKVSQSDTLYIFARAEGGGRAPLAVLRASAGKLPMTFALDDTMAMSPESRISQAEAVRIEARITRTGNATPQSGDLVGKSGVVKPGDRDVKVVVNEVVP